MAELGVTRILSLRKQKNPTEGVDFRHCPLDDNGTTNLFEIFESCFDFISQAKSANHVILVHCDGGINRAPTIVVGYLVSREKWTLEQAFNHVKKCRPKIAPRQTYFEQLQQLEMNIHGKITLQFEDTGPTLEQRMIAAKEEAKIKLSISTPTTNLGTFSGSFVGNDRLQGFLATRNQPKDSNVSLTGAATNNATTTATTVISTTNTTTSTTPSVVQANFVHEHESDKNTEKSSESIKKRDLNQKDQPVDGTDEGKLKPTKKPKGRSRSFLGFLVSDEKKKRKNEDVDSIATSSLDDKKKQKKPHLWKKEPKSKDKEKSDKGDKEKVDRDYEKEDKDDDQGEKEHNKVNKEVRDKEKE